MACERCSGEPLNRSRNGNANVMPGSSGSRATSESLNSKDLRRDLPVGWIVMCESGRSVPHSCIGSDQVAPELTVQAPAQAVPGTRMRSWAPWTAGASRGAAEPGICEAQTRPREFTCSSVGLHSPRRDDSAMTIIPQRRILVHCHGLAAAKACPALGPGLVRLSHEENLRQKETLNLDPSSPARQDASKPTPKSKN